MQVTKCESSQLRKRIFPGTRARLFCCSWVAVLLVVPPFPGMLRKEHDFREKMDFFYFLLPSRSRYQQPRTTQAWYRVEKRVQLLPPPPAAIKYSYVHSSKPDQLLSCSDFAAVLGMCSGGCKGGFFRPRITSLLCNYITQPLRTCTASASVAARNWPKWCAQVL